MSAYNQSANDREITGAIPLYSVVGDLDATQQIGPTINPQVDLGTALSDGASYGLRPGSGIVALLMAAAIIIAAYTFVKGNIKI